MVIYAYMSREDAAGTYERLKRDEHSVEVLYLNVPEKDRHLYTRVMLTTDIEGPEKGPLEANV